MCFNWLQPLNPLAYMHMVQDIKATWNFKFNHYSFCIRRLDKGIGKRNGEGVAHSLHTRDLRDEGSELETSSIIFWPHSNFRPVPWLLNWWAWHPGRLVISGVIRGSGKPLAEFSAQGCSLLPLAFNASTILHPRPPLHQNCLLANLWWSLRCLLFLSNDGDLRARPGY